MLYERWRTVVRESKTEIALVDAASKQRWTFEALSAEAERGPRLSAPSFPSGLSPAFLLAVLRAWQSQQVLCPLEEGQAAPALRHLPQRCIHVKSTSASTAAARLIAFSAEQLAADAAQIVASMRLRPDCPNLAVISMAHSYGFSSLVLPLLLHGIPLILASGPLPEMLRQAAACAGRITLPAVPALWRAWLDAAAIPSNLGLAISAGAPLPLPLEAAAFDRCGLKIHNFYGASECGGIAYDRTEVPRSDPSCVGAPLDQVNLSVDGDGRLQVRSAAVGLTYWPEPAPELAGGCYQTSDLARVEHGLVFLQGRDTDQINVAGRKVSPESIERVLALHPMVGECLVFGVPSARADRSETVVACVAAVQPASAEILKQHLLEHLPAWQIPRDWWFVERLTASRRGKVSRREWRQRYLEGRK